jgi:hypothetical protein
VQVTTCEIPNTWYPFDIFNNKLAYTIDDGDVVYIASMPTNKYYFNMSDLAVDIQEALNTAVDDENNVTDYVFSVSYTESKLAFLIAHGSGETKSFSFVACANSAYSMLGLSNYSESSPVDSYQCTQIANLQKTLAVYVICSAVPPVVYTSFNFGERTVAKIPVNKDTGNILTYQDSSDAHTPLDSSYISEMKLYLVDDRGFPIHLNGADWSIELSMSY